MTYDQAQSPRIRQRAGVENPGVRLIDFGDLPEVAYKGQIVYVKDTDYIMVYDGDAWQTVGDALTIRTFVQSSPPLTPAIGDQWLDTSSGLLTVWDGSDWVDPAVPDDFVGEDQIQAAALTTKHTITGSVFRTSASGNRIRMRNDGSGGVIEGYSGDASETSPTLINPGFDGNRPTLQLRSGSSSALPGATLMLYGDQASHTREANINCDTNVDGNLTANKLWADAMATGSGTALVAGVDGQIKYDSSTRAMKEDIEDLALKPETLIQLKPRQFRFKDDPDKRARAGFIVEEALGLGLSRWVSYDKQGAPMGFKYAEWAAAQQKILQWQDQRIKDLESRLVTVENIIKKLPPGLIK